MFREDVTSIHPIDSTHLEGRVLTSLSEAAGQETKGKPDSAEPSICEQGETEDGHQTVRRAGLLLCTRITAGAEDSYKNRSLGC